MDCCLDDGDFWVFAVQPHRPACIPHCQRDDDLSVPAEAEEGGGIGEEAEGGAGEGEREGKEEGAAAPAGNGQEQGDACAVAALAGQHRGHRLQEGKDERGDQKLGVP